MHTAIIAQGISKSFRTRVFEPWKQVLHEVDRVMDGDIDELIKAYLLNAA